MNRFAIALLIGALALATLLYPEPEPFNAYLPIEHEPFNAYLPIEHEPFNAYLPIEHEPFNA